MLAYLHNWSVYFARTFHLPVRSDNSSLPRGPLSWPFLPGVCPFCPVVPAPNNQPSDDKAVNRLAQDKAVVTPVALRVWCLPGERPRDFSALWGDTCVALSVERALNVSSPCTWVPFSAPLRQIGNPSPCRYSSCQYLSKNKCSWFGNIFSYMHRRCFKFRLLLSLQTR